MNKKVGILTFHRAENIGGMLQAYAMQKTLMNLGLDVRLIDYKNKGVRKRNVVKTIYYLLTLQPAYKRHKNFVKFLKKYLILTEKKYTNAKEFMKDADNFYAIIFGSDQIWNPNLAGGYDDLYFANFKTTAKKISYSASIGKDKISDSEFSTINHLLCNFDYISTREEDIQQKFDFDITCNIDPTLLLKKQDWIKLIKNNNKKEFIFTYQFYINPLFNKTVKIIQDKINKDIYIISPYKLFNFKTQKACNSAGPIEFLSYINNARVVITDSFHGVVFSIIFEKDFYVILPKGKGGRIKNLLKKINLESRIVDSFPIKLETINYSDAKLIIDKEVVRSIEYLEKSIKN